MYIAKKFLQLNLMVNFVSTVEEVTTAIEASPALYSLVFIDYQMLLQYNKRHSIDLDISLSDVIPFVKKNIILTVVLFNLPDKQITRKKEFQTVLKKHHVITLGEFSLLEIMVSFILCWFYLFY